RALRRNSWCLQYIKLMIQGQVCAECEVDILQILGGLDSANALRVRKTAFQNHFPRVRRGISREYVDGLSVEPLHRVNGRSHARYGHEHDIDVIARGGDVLAPGSPHRTAEPDHVERVGDPIVGGGQRFVGHLRLVDGDAGLVAQPSHNGVGCLSWVQSGHQKPLPRRPRAINRSCNFSRALPNAVNSAFLPSIQRPAATWLKPWSWNRGKSSRYDAPLYPTRAAPCVLPRAMSTWPAPSCMAPVSMRPTEPRASPVGVLDSGDAMIRCISSAASYAVSIMASSTPRTCCSDKRRMSLIMAAESPSRLTPRLAIDNLLVHHTPERV